MKIDFEHLGGIEKGSIELNDFTLFCGKNNSGKTYVMYALYGLLDKQFNCCFDFVEPIVDTLKQKGRYSLDVLDLITAYQEEIIVDVEKQFKRNLPNLFGVTDSDFLNSKIKLHLFYKKIEKNIENSKYSIYSANNLSWKVTLNADKEAIELILDTSEVGDDDVLQAFISNILVDILFFNCDEYHQRHNFLLPAERAGMNLFFKELFSIRNLLLQQAQNDSVNPMRLLKDVLKSRYAEPVKDYMQFLNRIGSDRIETSVYSEYAQSIEKNVLGGKYEVDEFGNVFFLPSDSQNKLPLHFSSSTVKTLFGLVFYLEHIAKSGDYLMIDEPELNLHPDNQREVARILAQLVNAGIKVVVSTHSNYFMREINNLIMLKNEFAGVEELRQKYQYHENELLDKYRVSAYLFDKKTIFPMPIDEEGIIVETFDTVTDALNQSSDDIYFTMQDAKDADN
ncbi:MAG: AAA family ATPase [Methylovulum miyakonense]|uniref:AAA family ATPase n=1 Tax=Methylovulum miyakonense TaxID=645578 RepID=UPI003BB6D54A